MQHKIQNVDLTTAIRVYSTPEEGETPMDPVHVFIEQTAPKQALVTLMTPEYAWVQHWGGVPESQHPVDFLLSCDDEYLSRKFMPHDRDQPDPEGWHARALEHIEMLSEEGYTPGVELAAMKEAAEGMIGWNCREDVDEQICYRVFGDEWYEYAPTKPTFRFERLQDALKAMREGLQQHKAMKQMEVPVLTALTVKEIADLADFAGLRLHDKQDADILEHEVTLAKCPLIGVLDEATGKHLHSDLICYMHDYPEEGVLNLGDVSSDR